jgi:hypothetical protein
MKRAALLHPALFLIGSLLYVYWGTAPIAAPAQILRPLVVSLIALGLLVWPAVKLAGDWERAALLLTVCVLGVCANVRFVLIVGLMFVVAIVPWMLEKSNRSRWPTWAEVNRLLTGTAILTTAILAVPFAKAVALALHPEHRESEAEDVVRAAGVRPDVYLVVLDGYARSDVLLDVYGFDNSEFVRFLQSRGFVVPARSRSNYAKTVLSVASMLNMEYVETIEPDLERAPYWWLMSRFISHSRTRRLLEKLGYRTVAVATDWGITDNDSVDTYLAPRTIMSSDFEHFLVQGTPLRVMAPLLSKALFVHSNDSHRELIRFNLRILGQLAAAPGPKFVFAHVVAPHPPFVFDAEGNSVDPGFRFAFADGSHYQGGADRYREEYEQQVRYVNNELTKVVDSIQRNSTSPAVILLQADHGPGMWMDMNASKKTCLKERFSAFSAYCLPGVDPHTIPVDTTPVNLFRIIFNQYYAGNFSMLPRAHYFNKDEGDIYHSEDVTSRVDTCVGYRRP